MGKNDGQLPKGWIKAPLGEICAVNMGQSPPSSTYNESGEGLPFFQGKAEFGPLYPEVRKWCSAPNKVAENGDILLSVRAPVGPTNLSPSRCCIGRGLTALTPAEGMNTRYIMHALRTYASDLEQQGTGTTFKAVSGGIVRDFQIPVAPTNEQERIVDKIEELLTDLDAGVSALERVRRNLARYRASVLNAAVAGRLTEQWRTEHPDAEPAEKLLERILTERRKRWEADYLAACKAKGRKPPKNWKAKYKPPAHTDTSKLPKLPKGWCWATVSQCSCKVQYGSSKKCSTNAKGVPVLRMGNIQTDGGLDLSDMRYLPADHDEFPTLLLEPGDLLFNRTNSAELVGKTAVYKNEPAPCSFASYLIRVRLLPSVEPSFLASCLNSKFGRLWIKTVVNQTVGQANVNGTKLSCFTFPLPPAAEQTEIVSQIDEFASTVTTAEEGTVKQLQRAARLRQSILKRAFEGKLVPQDPNDEPAEKLLARIRAGRKAHVAKAKPKRRRRNVKEVQHG